MSGDAIVMMLVAMAILWGGLAAAIIHVIRTGERPEQRPRRDL